MQHSMLINVDKTHSFTPIRSQNIPRITTPTQGLHLARLILIHRQTAQLTASIQITTLASLLCDHVLAKNTNLTVNDHSVYPTRHMTIFTPRI